MRNDHEPEPPADMGGYEMETIRDPSLAGPVFAISFVAVAVLLMILFW